MLIEVYDADIRNVSEWQADWESSCRWSQAGMASRHRLQHDEPPI
jgi:hypothetical protein